MPKKIHYSGPLQYRLRPKHIITALGNDPVCCRGPSAQRILNAGNYSDKRADVTCAACLRLLEKADEYRATENSQ